jgi:pyruvate-ferredoxin/flavodoxin oxidoreductase
MKTPNFYTLDANEAVANISYQLSEVIAIYPITPSSPMGEWADQWAANGMKNLWDTIPSVVEMQSEGGAAGAIHGALQTGSLATTFTASQGLLLMIPNMYKIAGELTPTVFHIAARSLAAQGLSIFGDHQDVMAARQTGWAMICSNSVQEAHDLALISHAAALESRIPFLHFFDGFRTSHEVAKIDMLEREVLRAMINEERVAEHRARALTPDRPVLRGTAQNPDVYFQARETVNPFYDRCADLVEQAMAKFGELTGRRYHLYEYHGAPDADRVIILMGSGCEAAHETVDYLNAHGAKVGILKVRLYRPLDAKRLIAAIPASTKSIAVLDRTKEPGAGGEPLYLDVITAFAEVLSAGEQSKFARPPRIVGGRYGLSSKEFTPAMVKAVFDNLDIARPKNHFTVGINDDVTHTSLVVDEKFSIEPPEVVRALFYGLGADGTVGANKESIKIIGENTPNYAQGYFVYDSKKSVAITISHLRFGPQAIRSTYLISQANFVACHQPIFLERMNVAECLVPGGTLLLNSPHKPEEVWHHLPTATQQDIINKKAKLYTIDALKVARSAGMGPRINTVMQTCFFSVSGVLPREEAIAAIKDSIKKAYGKKGEEIVKMNIAAVDTTLANLCEVKVPASTNGIALRPPVLEQAPEFVRQVLGPIVAGCGDRLPVSAMPCDGTFPTGTARWEKRNLATEVPVWDPQVCIQCGKCVFVCPHATIRSKVYEAPKLAGAPETFKSAEARLPEWKGRKYTIQVAVEDCTGCGVCVDVCPARNKSEAKLKAINMRPQPPVRAAEVKNWDFFLGLPELDRRNVSVDNVRGMQALEPLFEFSGACTGCGETPYVKLLTQLFGDRMVVANATGCSSIYGGNLPTTPWSQNQDGRGPAWSNSLFEDNAEFGLGFRVSIDKQREFAGELCAQLAPQLGDDLVSQILMARQQDEADIFDQRERVAELKRKLAKINSPAAKRLLTIADMLVRKSVWIIGGDGWGYDIGYGGLDHVLASGRNVKVLLLDTEVYSNTGGQASKSTPRGAVAKFAASGRPAAKKDLGLIAMTYGNIYVACVAMGAKDEHTLKAFIEAEQYNGPALIIAYSHCIAHGINMTTGLQNQKAAVNSGHWLLYRYNPERANNGENPLQLDSPAPRIKLGEYRAMENRYKMLEKSHPEHAKTLLAEAQTEVELRWKLYQHLAARDLKSGHGAAAPAATKTAATVEN